MKTLLAILLLVSITAGAQLTIQVAQDSAVRKYHIGSYSYHEDFIGRKGYGAPLILTADGGGAAFGDGDEGTMLVKMDKAGKVMWKKTFQPKGTEVESQSVVQDSNGNFYVFQLVYGTASYRGGCERVILMNKTGTVTLDKFLGSCNQVNNPIVSYIKALADGRIYLRGHIVTQSPANGKDPDTRFWEGWMNSKGVLTQKSGDIIDWKNPEWMKKFKPE